MAIADIPYQDIELGGHARADGQRFSISARLYEMPERFDYWHIPIDAHHAEWKHMRFVLVIPKKIAGTSELAKLFLTGLALEQVKACLESANQDGRPLGLWFGVEGWSLI